LSCVALNKSDILAAEKYQFRKLLYNTFASQLVAAAFQISVCKTMVRRSNCWCDSTGPRDALESQPLSSEGAFLNSTPQHFPPENFDSHAADAKRCLLHRKVSNQRPRKVLNTLFFCAHRFAAETAAGDFWQRNVGLILTIISMGVGNFTEFFPTRAQFHELASVRLISTRRLGL